MGFSDFSALRTTFSSRQMSATDLVPQMRSARTAARLESRSTADDFPTDSSLCHAGKMERHREVLKQLEEEADELIDVLQNTTESTKLEIRT